MLGRKQRGMLHRLRQAGERGAAVYGRTEVVCCADLARRGLAVDKAPELKPGEYPRRYAITESGRETLAAREEREAEMGVIKQCGCGRTYTAEQWKRLPYCGTSDLGQLELRHCRCGSTIGVPLEDVEPTPDTLRGVTL